ncbi:MAG: DUF547 domain-containing protein [Salinibacter sp.]|uniref:DUF547 domain-containing protein n=1 Tax=Salinibacter sp. TaxID=2065818 RepID=UPI0035D458D0
MRRSCVRLTAVLTFVVLLPLPALAQSAAPDGPLAAFYQDADRLLRERVTNGRVDYAALRRDPSRLQNLVQRIERQDLAALPPAHADAFLLNAYNLLTLHAVVEAYPIPSPLEVEGFFDEQTHTVAGQKMTLDELEAMLFDQTLDPRFHFALVCAAEGCPALIDHAYRGDSLDAQLERKTRRTLNDTTHVQVDPESQTIRVSKIFDWYRSHFTEGGTSISEYISQYRSAPLPSSYDLSFKEYDWGLNDLRDEDRGDPVSSKRRDTRDAQMGFGSRDTRDDQRAQSQPSLQTFTAATLVEPGQVDIKLFNNLYTQTAYFNGDGERLSQERRSTYFTGILTSFVGVTPTLNLGAELYFKSVRNDSPDSSPFRALTFESRSQSRTSLTAIAPQAKYAPPTLGGTTLQFTLLVPLSQDFDGVGSDRPFLSHGDVQVWAQAFYDLPLYRNQLLLFLETGLLGRFDTRATRTHELTVPLKGILNYYPSDQLTLYGLAEVAPKVDWTGGGGYRSQLGIGAKYELLPGLQLETLVSTFPLGINSGAGMTYNFGLQIVR